VRLIGEPTSGTVRVRGASYEVIFEPDLEDGGWVVECPALPGCVLQGRHARRRSSDDPRRDRRHHSREATRAGEQARGARHVTSLNELDPARVIRALRRFGWEVARSSGSHQIMRKEGHLSKLMTCVPRIVRPCDSFCDKRGCTACPSGHERR
jgi:predicted RNA binding protein YcfA (HicA-like mRNA interferase family)